MRLHSIPILDAGQPYITMKPLIRYSISKGGREGGENLGPKKKLDQFVLCHVLQGLGTTLIEAREVGK